MSEPRKVLVAEDDRMTQRLLTATLTQHPALKAHGFEVVLAADGQAAVEQFGVVRPDLVIVDLFMPRLDGFSVCRAIRESPYGARVPIVVTSAVWKQPELLGQLRADYGVEFVAKPFKPDDLVRVVQSVLLRGSAG